MKNLNLDGITYIDLIPEGTDEWYFGISYEHGDLYEAEEVFQAGGDVKGRKLCLIHYPDGEVFWPVSKRPGTYLAEPVYLDGSVYMLNVDFTQSLIQIIRFDCASHVTDLVTELPLNSVKDCYNLGLDTAPLILRRQGGADNLFEIIWPERISFSMGEHESFFLRDGDKLFFSKWYEEGDGVDYKYWEETVIRNLDGEIIDIFPGDVRIMPNGEMWYLK